MQSITFECEVITPMFLAGADGSTPELRPPSIKGALRFWWRALNGHLPLKDEKNQKDLKTIEGKIFGDTSQQSNFKIRITEQNLNTQKISALPHKERGFRKSAVIPNERFDVSFLTKETDKGTYAFNTIKSLFPLVAVLGGVGNRSRRGFGGFRINSVYTEKNSIHGKEIYNGIIYPNTLPKLLSLLNTLGNNNFVLTSNQQSINFKGIALEKYPYIKKIEIGRPNPNLVLKIGRATHDTNRNNGRLYKDAIGSPFPRFASPIYVSVIETNRGMQPIITTLNHHKGNYQYDKVQQQLINAIL